MFELNVGELSKTITTIINHAFFCYTENSLNYFGEKIYETIYERKSRRGLQQTKMPIERITLNRFLKKFLETIFKRKYLQ